MINKYGEKKITLTGIISSVIAIIELFFIINSIVPEEQAWGEVLVFDSTIHNYLLGFGMVLLIFGFWWISLVDFKNNSHVKNVKNIGRWKKSISQP